MARKPVPIVIQTSVLLKSRRRCCICFGLNRDTSIKQGQIAHLDNDASNSAEDNLTFLCLDHHDQYDSTSRQSKNFTQSEIKMFRSELYASIDLAFAGEVLFGRTKTISNIVPGHYIRYGQFESAELKVRLLANGQYHILSQVQLFGERNIGTDPTPEIWTLLES